MSVKARRDDDEVGRERLDPRQDHDVHGLTESLARVASPQRRVDDLVVLAALPDRASAGIKRHLMGRTVDDGRIVPEDVLRAVAMMHVEIDDRDPFGAVGRLGVARGDRCVIEEAEAHRVRDFGVVPRRARGDEGVANLAAHHFVDGEDGAAGRAQRSFVRARRQRRILVDRRQSLFGRRRADRVDIVFRMDPLDGGQVGARRDVARQHLKDLAFERALDSAQAVRPFGMALPHVVRQACGVTDDERGHGLMS